MLLGSCCVVCDAPGDAVCASCAAALPPAPNLAVPLHLDRCDALFAYDDAVRLLVTRLKNRHRRDLVRWFADRAATACLPLPGSVVTWAPTSAARRAARGFDQAELLARALARRWRLPVRPLLTRRPGPPQSGRSAEERRANPGFGARSRPPRQVVLVDDVATTGATLTAAARALRGAGTADVRAVVMARS